VISITVYFFCCNAQISINREFRDTINYIAILGNMLFHINCRQRERERSHKECNDISSHQYQSYELCLLLFLSPLDTPNREAFNFDANYCRVIIKRYLSRTKVTSYKNISKWRYTAVEYKHSHAAAGEMLFLQSRNTDSAVAHIYTQFNTKQNCLTLFCERIVSCIYCSTLLL